MKIVLTGATGLVGSQILEALIHDQRVETIEVLTRRPIEITHSKVKCIELNPMDPGGITSANVEGSIFICALGTTIKDAGSQERFRFVDFELVVAFAKLAERLTGDKLYIVSAKGANEKSRIFYNRVKGEMENVVSAISIASVYFLQPGLLIGDRPQKRPLEQFGIAAFQFSSKFLPQKWTRYVGTGVDQIVDFVCKTLEEKNVGIKRIDFLQ